MLISFARDVWVADGAPVNVLGPIKMPARAIVVRLRDGSLWVNSPIALAPDETAEISQLGAVRYLVAPTRLHVWRLPAWKQLFADAQLWGPPDVGNPYQGVRFDGVLGDDAPAAWATDMGQTIFKGNAMLQEVEFLHRSSGTLMITDFVQNYSALVGHPLRNAFLKITGLLGGGVPPDIRASFRHRDLARESLQRILAWDFDKLIPAHGDCITSDAKAFVQRAFTWLR